MTPGGEIIPITEDDQGEGYMDVIELEDLEHPSFLDEILKRKRRNDIKSISKV